MPETVGTDDGYASDANLRWLKEAIGVNDVGFGGAKGRKVMGDCDWTMPYMAAGGGGAGRGVIATSGRTCGDMPKTIGFTTCGRDFARFVAFPWLSRNVTATGRETPRRTIPQANKGVLTRGFSWNLKFA